MHKLWQRCTILAVGRGTFKCHYCRNIFTSRQVYWFKPCDWTAVLRYRLLHFHWIQNMHNSDLTTQQSVKSIPLNWHKILHLKKGVRIQTQTVLSRLFHIDDVLTSRCIIYSVKWIKGRRSRGRKWGWGVKERKIICQGFILREALSWMPNVAKLMPVSSGTSRGLATSALWKVTTTKCFC